MADDMAAWRDLEPDPEMVDSLEVADGKVSRTEIREELGRVLALPTDAERKRERAVLRDMRKRWSELFATGCATMIANEVRSHSVIGRRYSVLPDEHGRGQETFTPLGYSKGKRIDVVITGPLVGLQVGVSLKGLNFADDSSGNHDKNLTGRLYELRDEVSTVHDYLPRAFMAAFFFMPVSGCVDKTNAASSFAHLVAELRARTGRLDPAVAAHGWRCDFAAVGLYGAGDPWEEAMGLTRGVARYFPILNASGSPNPPPARGLPIVATTTDLAGVVDRLLATAIAGTATATDYADPEPGSDVVVNLASTANDSTAGNQLKDDEELSTDL